MPTEARITGSRPDRSRQCTGRSASRIRDFIRCSACYDLTRTGTLPASDGCPSSTSGLYTYPGHADIKELALYVQDTITIENWTFNLGMRGDSTTESPAPRQAEPRAGHRLQHQADQHRAARLLRAHTGNSVQRKPGAGQPGMQRPGDQCAHVGDAGISCALTAPLSPGYPQ